MEKISFPSEISLFFNDAIKFIKKHINPEFIFIAGSFGKNAWIYHDKKLLSDFEFVFICKNKWSFHKKKYILKDLNNKYQFNINLKGYLLKNINKKIISNYSISNPGYLNLNFFDAFNNPLILYSKYNKNFHLSLSSHDIPIWEGWRLYVNRMGDLIQIIDSDKLINKKYCWLKIFESIGDVYLITNKIYAKDFSEKEICFINEITKKRYSKNPIINKTIPIVMSSFESRKKHSLKYFKIDDISDYDKLEITIFWLRYFEEKLSNEEKLINEYGTFYENYLATKNLQKKYLETSGFLSIFFSNVIRFLYNYKKLSSLNFLFNFKISWRHTSLVLISTLYKDYFINNNFYQSNQILSTLVKVNDNNTISYSIKFWKILR